MQTKRFRKLGDKTKNLRSIVARKLAMNDIQPKCNHLTGFSSSSHHSFILRSILGCIVQRVPKFDGYRVVQPSPNRQVKLINCEYTVHDGFVER